METTWFKFRADVRAEDETGVFPLGQHWIDEIGNWPSGLQYNTRLKLATSHSRTTMHARYGWTPTQYKTMCYLSMSISDVHWTMELYWHCEFEFAISCWWQTQSYKLSLLYEIVHGMCYFPPLGSFVFLVIELTTHSWLVWSVWKGS